MAITARTKPSSPLWSPGNPLGAGLTWGTLIDGPGSKHRNYVAPGVSDVSVVAGAMGTGELGRELQLSGSAQYARAPLSPALKLAAPASWAVLARSNGSPGSFKYPLAIAIPGSEVIYGIAARPASPLPAAFVRLADGAYLIAQSASYTWDARYHLYAATYTADGTLTLYVDGLPRATATGDGTVYSYATATALCIGAAEDTLGGTYYWPGAIAAAYTWSRPLSSRDQLRLAVDPFSPFRRRPRPWLAAGIPTAAAPYHHFRRRRVS